MPLEDFLMPGETIKFRLGQVEFQGDTYEFLITDKRLLWYRSYGLLRKKDVVVSQAIEEILEIKYKEEGLVRKKGIIEIVTEKKKTSFSGPPEQMKELYKELQTILKGG